MATETFTPTPQMLAQLQANRAGKFTPAQKRVILLGALFSAGGILCISGLAVQMIAAMLAGFTPGGIVGWLFLIFFLISFTVMGLTFYFNARSYIPEVLGNEPVKQARGVLKIQMPQRERVELPFSYIVGDYSFAPFMVPYEVPMETGREYIVYYAARSRMFLSIEPVEAA